jgi:hypothetical protein
MWGLSTTLRQQLACPDPSISQCKPAMSNLVKLLAAIQHALYGLVQNDLGFIQVSLNLGKLVCRLWVLLTTAEAPVV